MMKTKNIVVLILIILLYISAIAQTGGSSSTGTFTDKRDNKTYRTVRIGNLTWMAENLNFHTDSSWCYDNADSNCVRYGRLYTWYTARTACPAGWRLPTNSDWDNLSQVVGGQLIEKKGGGGFADDYVWERYWRVAGGKLKSKTGWVDKPMGNGTDEFGFSALPGGGRSLNQNNAERSEFIYAGQTGHWWSATEVGGGLAYSRYMSCHTDYVDELEHGKHHWLSVRCSHD